MTEQREQASFRDPASFVYWRGEELYRSIALSGIKDFQKFNASPLLKELIDEGQLLPHEVIDYSEFEAILKPERLPLISYPYEWSFSQLKDAAILTLDIQEKSLHHGLWLKDASAYNVQFRGPSPVFIDIGSFETYTEGQPWRAYRQFCEHFLAPLLLMSRSHPGLQQLLRANLDGIPLDVATSAVKSKTWFNPLLSLHVRSHAKAKAKQGVASEKKANIPTTALLGLINTLRSALNALHSPSISTEWGGYSSASSYETRSAAEKHRLVSTFAELLPNKPSQVWDLGANAGEFSRIFSRSGIMTVAWDIDPVAVEKNYLQAKKDSESHLLPLLQDLTNPSPSLGWMGTERKSFFERGPVDLVLALALIHHIVIGNSVPMSMAAEFFARVGRNLIIEFVEPEDPRVMQLLSSRSASHPYSREVFESAFRDQFEVLRREQIPGSARSLYLMRLKSSR